MKYGYLIYYNIKLKSNFMKRLAFIPFALFFLLTSCDIDIEPGYDPADRVTGTYWVEEYSSTFDEFTEFQIRIYKNGYGRVQITNFYGVDVTVNADVRGNELYIPFQVRDGYEIEGRASISGGRLF